MHGSQQLMASVCGVVINWPIIPAGVAGGDDDGARHADGVEDLHDLTGDIVQRTHVDHNLLARSGRPSRR